MAMDDKRFDRLESDVKDLVKSVGEVSINVVRLQEQVKISHEETKEVRSELKEHDAKSAQALEKSATALEKAAQAFLKATELEVRTIDTSENIELVKTELKETQEKLQTQGEWFRVFPKLRQVGMWIITAAAASKILWDIFSGGE
jgi:chromosome segregation ATPase